jgi:hypothetical protein
MLETAGDSGCGFLWAALRSVRADSIMFQPCTKCKWARMVYYLPILKCRMICMSHYFFISAFKDGLYPFYQFYNVRNPLMSEVTVDVEVCDKGTEKGWTFGRIQQFKRWTVITCVALFSDVDCFGCLFLYCSKHINRRLQINQSRCHFRRALAYCVSFRLVFQHHLIRWSSLFVIQFAMHGFCAFAAFDLKIYALFHIISTEKTTIHLSLKGPWKRWFKKIVEYSNDLELCAT